MKEEKTGVGALNLLTEGNLRFAHNQSQNPSDLEQRRLDLRSGQAPFAVVVGCSDSRVCPEIIFDVNLGDLFVIRTAGHVIDESVLGSMQYAVKHLHVPLIVVLGHSCCGAVQAAVDRVKEVKSLNKLIKSIHHTIKDCLCRKGIDIDHVIEEHTKLDTEHLKDRWSFFAPYIKSGDLTIIAAHYDMATGLVKFFNPEAEGCESADVDEKSTALR